MQQNWAFVALSKCLGTTRIPDSGRATIRRYPSLQLVLSPLVKERYPSDLLSTATPYP